MFDQSRYSISARDRTCRGSAIIACTMDEEKLIETVRGFPCLWQVSCKGYKDVRAKENAWTEVATQVSIILTTC